MMKYWEQIHFKILIKVFSFTKFVRCSRTEKQVFQFILNRKTGAKRVTRSSEWVFFFFSFLLIDKKGDGKHGQNLQ